MEQVSVERMKEKIRCFSQFGDTGHGGITRLSLSPAAHAARDEFVRRMKAIGATIESDDLANLYATIPGSDPTAGRIAAGSHVDSVRRGGNYDGILGVLGAMEALETVVREKIPHRHPLTALIWTNEEGAEFPPAMLSSGVVAGVLDEEKMLASRSTLDPTRCFADALRESPYQGKREKRLNPAQYCGLFELHIEQGPILEEKGMEIGVVQCVLGMLNVRIRFHGQATHAGTTPMPKRRDALHAAATALCRLHSEIDALGVEDLVYTTGEILCEPCVHTVVPALVEFSLDARHKDPAVLDRVRAVLDRLNGSELLGCRCEVEPAWARDTVRFDPRLVDCVQRSADGLGLKNCPINSGAGHDAQYMAGLLPTAMIFVPSRGGHSHSELEYTAPEQCAGGASVLLNAMLLLDEEI